VSQQVWVFVASDTRVKLEECMPGHVCGGECLSSLSAKDLLDAFPGPVGAMYQMTDRQAWVAIRDLQYKSPGVAMLPEGYYRSRIKPLGVVLLICEQDADYERMELHVGRQEGSL